MAPTGCDEELVVQQVRRGVRGGRRGVSWGVVLAGVLAVAVVTAGCSRDEEPPPEPEPVAEPEPEPEPVPEPEPAPEPEPEPGPTSPFTGEEVDEEVLERALVAVKIDNVPQARPQTGLEAADIVIEERVEAGVTRFMALFHSEIPDNVGPTRSARPVDAQLIAGFDRSGFVYSGARAEVRGLLANTPAIQVTEGGAGFYRMSGRRAPHNLYNRLPQALDAVMQRDPTILDDIGWVFDEGPPDGEDTCPPTDDSCEDPGTSIQIAMSSSYRTGWEYDPAEGVYRRSQNGQPFTVTGEDRIGAANVVVLGTRHYLGQPNCYGARCPETDVTTSGERAIVLRDGNRYEARWRKPTAGDRLEILTVDGDPFPLKPGKTWVHLPSTSNLPAPVGAG